MRASSFFACAATVFSLFWATPQAAAFCGFYVAKADANLFNRASKVVIAREGRQTVITMANDYEGEPDEFAMVIPAPYVLARNQIRVEEAEKIDKVDAYSAPRLAEYFDRDPCAPPLVKRVLEAPVVMAAPAPVYVAPSAADFGVTIEATYEVEEYDILILSAEDSSGLQRWLDLEGYRVPSEARDVLAHYIQMGMKFFVAKVDLTRIEAAKDPDWDGYLRPLQIAFESDDFMLPIRLGTVNADGAQDLIVYLLTPEGRVEVANYPTVEIPTDKEVPPTVEKRFDDFYRRVFERQHAAYGGKAVFTEYSWPLQQKCDPCVAGTPSQQELIELGATWLAEDYVVAEDGAISFTKPTGRRIGPAHLTRLHLRYTAETFPDDLAFRVTEDTERFQGRYVMRHPFRGNTNCPAGHEYLGTLNARHKEEAANLAELTGWEISEIRERMRAAGYVAPTVSAAGDYSFDTLADWRAWMSRDDEPK